MGWIDGRPRLKKALLNLLSLCLGIIAAVLIAEVAVRIVHAFVYGRGSGYYYPIVSDPALGWRATENFDSRSVKRDAAGAPYEVHFTTDDHGFRVFGDPHTAKPKVLVIGDSYTHAVDASNKDAYFSVLAGKLPVEVFAYGAGGFGTLQEYMVLDREIDRIRPDVVLVQFASNDFANNAVLLERRSTDNNSRYRPNLMPDGTIRLLYPARNNLTAWFAGTRSWLASHLRIMNEVFRAVDVIEPRLLPKLGFSYVEPEIKARNGDVPAFRDAAAATEAIFKMIVKRAGSARVYAFTADDPEPYVSAFASAARTAGVTVIEAPARTLRTEEQRGTCVRAMDRSHWNPAGHRIVGEALAAYFLTEGLHVHTR